MMNDDQNHDRANMLLVSIMAVSTLIAGVLGYD